MGAVFIYVPVTSRKSQTAATLFILSYFGDISNVIGSRVNGFIRSGEAYMQLVFSRRPPLHLITLIWQENRKKKTECQHQPTQLYAGAKHVAFLLSRDKKCSKFAILFSALLL